MGKKIVVESDFEDLHGNPEDAPDLELDLSDEDNPIIKAALSDEDDDWKPPADDDDDGSDDEDEDDEDEDDDDTDTDDDDDESDSDEDDDDDSEDDDEEEDDDDDDEDDDENYSKNVRKRIDRERSLRRQDNEAANKRIAKLERRQELRDAQDDFAKEKREADAKLRKLKKQKVAALDEEETTKVVDIDDEILDIKADIKAKELQLQQTKTDLENDDGDDEPTGNIPDAGRRWLEKYPQFHTDEKFKRVVLLTDRSVTARGFDKNTDEYYEEMENILRAQFPKIIKRKVKVTKKGGKKRKKNRSAVGSTTKAGTRRSSKSRSRRGRIRLTKADQEQMSVFGLDPKNPVDAKAWAEGKGN